MEIEGSSKSNGLAQLVATPFVLKTYRMVNDPASDSVICWGRESNSFVVADPLAFSQTLLPARFQHKNFSSFVRQLNTYGFRKVDPDRWEFAHTSFLKGQTHLLRQIVRRNSSNSSKTNNHNNDTAITAKNQEEYEVDDDVVLEVLKLKQEQSSTDEKVQRMWRRLQETEKKPKLMLAFLVKVVGDPQLLQRLMRRSGGGEEIKNAGKRARPRLEEPKLDVDEGIDMLSLDCEDLVVGGEDGVFLGGDDDFGVVDRFFPTVDPLDMCGGGDGGDGGDDLGGLGMSVGDVF